MTMASKLILSAVLLVFVPICSPPQGRSLAAQESQSQGASQPAAARNNGETAAHKPTSEGEGDRIFQQNCSRCHWAPDGFSSRISGTIVRHMRARAALSPHDEQELLRFLNP
jgi:hypothetical protein